MSSSERKSDCGCETGAAFGGIALLSWPFIWLALRGFPATVLVGVRALVVWMGVVIAAALTGKVIGVVLARLRRHRKLTRRPHASASA